MSQEPSVGYPHESASAKVDIRHIDPSDVYVTVPSEGTTGQPPAWIFSCLPSRTGSGGSVVYTPKSHASRVIQNTTCLRATDPFFPSSVRRSLRSARLDKLVCTRMIASEGNTSPVQGKEGQRSASNLQDVTVTFQFGTLESEFEGIGEVLDAPDRHLSQPKGPLGALGDLWWAM